MLASESDLDLIARSIARTPPRGAGNVTMPFIALKNHKGFRFWADERKRTGFEANAESFTDNLVNSRLDARNIRNKKRQQKMKTHQSPTD